MYSSLLYRFRPDNSEPELPQPLRPSVSHIHALLICLSALIHSSPPENGALNELQQPSTPLHVDPRVLLARLFSFLHRSQLNIDEEAESHHTPPLSSCPDVLIRLSSLFRSQYTNEEIELAQRTSRPRVVDVAAVRDRQALVVARAHNSRKQNEHTSDKSNCMPKPRRHHRTLSLPAPLRHPRHILQQEQQLHNHHLSHGGLTLCCFSAAHLHTPMVVNTSSIAAPGQLCHLQFS
ncbi:hypothetical protein CY34DRAFT_604246 [Suillus luteus UH-Slu-Lm8-n1]|uniref:Uncharacterized protein n=1 Tax=Suillus luteus UH-Slu-Lm8-n1 TaxID=930992 RepID=A0A0C9ZZW6_9AGAM|nr:hypothetical protein CY34DRAFT_604246 [Suillus luteus UH-Slu-Lm8-n1]